LGVIAIALAVLLSAGPSHAAGSFTYTYTETWTPSETLTHTQSNTETRTPSPTATATRTRTFTRTVTPTFVIRIVVQTMAGEQVRSFSRGMPPESVIPNEILLQPNPFSPDCDGNNEWVNVIGFTTGAQQAWDGKNDRGEPVENGRYWITVSLFDTVGVLRGQYVRDVLLLAKGNVIRVAIYDLAGHARKEFAKICLPVKMTDFELDPNPFTPGVDSAGAWKYLRIKINGVVTGLPQWPPPPTPNNNFQLIGGLSNIFWLGDDVDGKLLPNGTYWVHAENIDPNGKKTVYSKSLIILRGKFDLMKDLWAYPDPYFPADETTMYFAYSCINGDPLDCRVRIYDLTGRFIAQREFGKDGGGPDICCGPNRYRIPWNAMTEDKKYLADGIYYVEYSARDLATGVREIKRIKFAITRKPTN